MVSHLSGHKDLINARPSLMNDDYPGQTSGMTPQQCCSGKTTDKRFRRSRIRWALKYHSAQRSSNLLANGRRQETENCNKRKAIGFKCIHMKHFNYYESQRGLPGLPSAACRCDHVIAMATTTCSLFSMCDEALKEVAELDRVTIIVNKLWMQLFIRSLRKQNNRENGGPGKSRPYFSVSSSDVLGQLFT